MQKLQKYIINIVFSSLGIMLIILLFPLGKFLVVIPLILFVISLLVKSKIVAILLNTLTILPFLIIFTGSKIKLSEVVIIESDIRYQMIELGQGDLIRYVIERKLGNRRIFLTKNSQNAKWLYIDSKDFAKLHPELPREMRRKGYTMHAKFEVCKTMIGGYSKAKIIHYDKIEGNPVITK